ncbi:Glu-tRNA(Gln) amidotransferase GatDE subunit E [Candidatus Woesearchaeota archaeon]|nr:MAG: Glu-tRNA(Gln) amidotransferase GatDE subunit E [Candidatus Woesearchaeota archaeon]
MDYSKLDYEKLGFKCGLEIHQQIEGKKLFCNCPTLNSKEKPDIRFERRLRAVAGETGDVDKAAKYETRKAKKYIYEADSRDCCLVEMDEEPPHPINKDAVDVCLQVALVLKAKIVDEIQVMRKTVVDGSNVSGFQRTALVAYDGSLETSKGIVRIPTICVEEEAAQKVETTKDYTKYRLDRLGIPLIEIATGPDIKDNEHAKEVAEKLGMILRSTKKVKRGIGTIRQDVNVSIRGKNRVEIKGFQEIRTMPAVIEREVKRQLSLKKKEEAHVRKVEPDGSTSYLRPMPGAARMYPETDVVPLKPDLKNIGAVKLISDEAKELEKIGLSKDLAYKLVKSEKKELFDQLVKNRNVKPSFIAETLVSYTPEILRNYKGKDPFRIKDEHFIRIFEALNKGEITKDSVMELLVDVASGKELIIEKSKAVSDEEIEKEVKKVVSENKNASVGALMGILMGKFRGRADGKKVMEILKKNV